jgi:hypothetical protein
MASIAKDTRLLVNQYDISSAFKAIKPSHSVDDLDSTTFGTSGGKGHAAGLKDGSLSCEGFFDADTVNVNKIDDLLGTAIVTPSIVSYAPAGLTSVGLLARLLSANRPKYEVNTTIGQIVGVTAELSNQQMGLELGVVLHAQTSETTTVNGASVDNAASSTSGAVGHLHVTAKADTTAVWTIKIQHSTDNSTFVDLITFTNVSNRTLAAGAQRIEVTGTINRYTRVQCTLVSGTTSITPVVTFARR